MIWDVVPPHPHPSGTYLRKKKAEQELIND
jgi:hypothetical protein